jgi:hypothetical protein
MRAEIEIENADEILYALAVKEFRDRSLARLAVRLIRGDTGLFPLRCYPLSIQNFVNTHSTNQERNTA